MSRALAGTALGIAVALVVFGCSSFIDARLGLPARVGPEVQVGAGVAADGPWTAWIYRDRDRLTCLMIREASGAENGGCGSGTGPNVSGGPPTTYVYGSTLHPAAASARITLADNSRSTTAVALPPDGVTEGVRHFVAGLPGAAVVTKVEILDGAGVVVESYPLAP
jgi:hypothetical protein